MTDAVPPAVDHHRCRECGFLSSGPYCPNCGTPSYTPERESVRWLLSEWSADALGMDGRIVRTLRTLFLQPGHLTAEYLAGRRKRFIRPFQLFLIVNAVFVLVAVSQGIYDFTLQEYLDFSPPSTDLTRRWVSSALAETGLSYPVYEAKFNGSADALRKGLILLLIPFFAGASWVLCARLRGPVVPHLVFSVHVFAFYWLYVSLLAPPLRMAVERLGFAADAPVFYFNMAVLGSYLFVALRRIHGQSRLLTAAKSLALVACVIVLLRSYRVLLFFGTFALT